MYQIINVKHTAGKMDNGAEYDNYKFTCLSDTDSKALVCGRNVEVFSCPASTFENVCRSRNLNRLAFEGCYLISIHALTRRATAKTHIRSHLIRRETGKMYKPDHSVSLCRTLFMIKSPKKACETNGKNM